MRLESARDLKEEVLASLVVPVGNTTLSVGARPFETLPQIHRTIAIGVAHARPEYRLAVRVQRPELMTSALVERIVDKARGEADVRMIGRIDKRPAGRARRAAPRQAVPDAVAWYQANTRPLLIGASVGHVSVTAGTITAFVTRAGRTCILSNNHVLANEDQASAGDWILQRAKYDGGRQPGERIARLSYWVRLKARAGNMVDAALADLEPGIAFDPSRLRGLVDGRDATLAGVAPAFIDEGEVVYKTGRTTGATKGRVTAFDLDNVVVNYDAGNLRFDNQIEIEGVGERGFSDGGDSGSLIVNGGMKAVALLFAGGDSGGSNGRGLTFANPIGQVLDDLKATLLFHA